MLYNITVDINSEMNPIALDIATMFMVLPWVFLHGDKRDPQALVTAALSSTMRFMAGRTDASARRALMRGLALNWFKTMGAEPDPQHMEMIVGLVQQAVDASGADAHQLEGEIDAVVSDA